MSEQLSIDSKNYSAEKRYLPRWDVNNRIFYQFVDDTALMEGRLKNLSCGGACIENAMKLLPEHQIKITIYFTAVSTLSLEGKVLWTRNGDGKKEVGVIFDNVSDQDQELILQQAFQNNKKEIVDHWFEGWEGNN